MTDTLRNMPRYIRNTDAFGWQGADSANGPWRSITPPQSGMPWQTTSPMDDLRQASADVSGVAVQSREPASVVTRPSDDELFDAAESYAEDNGLIGLHNAPDFARAVLARWGNLPKEVE